MATKIYHFLRISGMKRIYSEEDSDFFPTSYKYYGKPFKINPQAHVLIVFCNNCHENHTYNQNNCELVYNHRQQVHTIHLFNATEKLIWIHNHQSIIKLYRQWPQLFYGNGRYISELDFFSNVTQNQETNKNIKQICVFCPTASHPIKICCNNRQKNTRLARGWTFFCLCCPSHTTKYNFQPFATGLLVPVTCSNPITQFYILYENFTPPTLFHLSLSSAVQHNLNNALDVTRNIIPKNICQRAPSCHKRHLLPFAMRQFNPNCAGYEMHSPLICDW
jgi:hypothetical protein